MDKVLTAKKLSKPVRLRYFAGAGLALLFFLLLAPPCFGLLGCGAAKAAGMEGRIVHDQRGNPVRVPENPRRIVALAPNLVELLFELGAGDLLAGRTLYSDYPKAALGLPQVGSYYRPDLERILALEPDLCLAMEDGTPVYIREKIAQCGIALVTFKTASLADLPEAIALLGALTGYEAEAALLRGRFESELDSIRAEGERRAARAGGRARALLQLQDSPVIAAGPNSFLGELLEAAGGANPVRTLPGQNPYPRLSAEEILALQPEVIIAPLMHSATSPNGGGGGGLGGGAGGARSPAPIHEKRFLEFWKKRGRIPAVADGRVHILRADIFTRPSMRSLDAMRLLLDLLYPGPDSATGSAPDSYRARQGGAE